MRLIDADALMEVIRSNDYILSDRYNSRDFGMFTVGIQQAVDQAPTIESKASEGRWKGAGMGDYRCSLCDGIVNGKYKFCPYCGDRKEDTA